MLSKLVRVNEGDLTANMEKNGKKFVRKLNPDRNILLKMDQKLSFMEELFFLNRNVGHLMTNPAIILKDGSEIPEGIMDAFISTLCALHDFKNKNNSRTNHFILLNQKCMVQKKWLLQIHYLKK